MKKGKKGNGDLSEAKEANRVIREEQKKRALNLLWDHGWTEDEIATALSMPKKKIREWKDKRMKKWEGQDGK